MAKHKLILDDVFEESYFTLIAIHCSLEDYRLAYLLNKNLSLNLKRKEEDLDYDYVSAFYPIFEWEDLSQQITFNLVGNICRKESNALTSSGLLFGDDEKSMRTLNLIPEHKNVDYLLKISAQEEFSEEKSILNKILEIPNIVTAYSIDAFKLKSRNNLIFN
ncbi:MAG: IPExxxVDY family protein [Bacteroidia bacterium]|nr:IPExxxVDY family protein [Bacteroidia bacterium]